MAVANQPKPKREYNYGDIVISLENCILQEDKLSETPSMKDGLDRETETSLRIFACELIQTSGILLKLPQVAMATGQVLLQRFYYSKSFVKHDFEIYAMACVFLAAKIEEAPRRLRDVVNVFHHIKQKRSGRPITPMDCVSNTYVSLKNQVIKAERRVLKELGFCVHVKHPHKVIITYLQILECEKNVDLAQKAWNYMNDCLRSDVFVKYAPEKIGCACIFLAARQLKIPLPSNPPWWELFGSRLEEVEEIAIIMLGIYARPKISRSKLELAVEKAKKLVQDKKDATKEGPTNSGSFTPAHISPASNSGSTLASSKPGSPTKISPAESTTSSTNAKRKQEKLPSSYNRGESKYSETKKKIERDRSALGIRPTREEKRPPKERQRSPTPPKRRKQKSESETSTESESESGSSSGEEESRNVAGESSNEETSSSSSEEEETKTVPVKRHKTESVENRRTVRVESRKDRPRVRKDMNNENGHKSYQYDYNKRIRSRSPYKRSKSRSRSRSRERHLKKEKKPRMKKEIREKRLERFHSKEKTDRDRHYVNNSADRYDRFSKKIKR